MKVLNTPLITLILALGFNSALLSLPAAAVQANPAQVKATRVAEQAGCACFEVTVVGEGPAIILIPGLASSGDVWQSTVAALKADYQLHVLTLAGFGGVAPLTQDAWTQGFLPSQQEAVLRYIRQQNLDKPVVIGHSLGGYLALALAVTAPELIGGAVNVDGLPALGALQHGAPYSTPEQVQANYEKQLANAPAQYHRFAFAADSKHFIMADAPEWLNQQITAFLHSHNVHGE